MDEKRVVEVEEVKNVPYSSSDEHETLLRPTERKEEIVITNSGFYFTYFTFLLCGVCTVFPWNVFITAKPYFDDKLSENITNAANTTSYKDLLEVFFGIGSQVTSLVMQFVMTSVIYRISLDLRMYLSLGGMLLIFLITAVLAWVPVFDWLNVFYYTTVATVIFISAFSAIFQSSTFGLSGVFPKEFMHATMIGQGIGGVVVSVFEIFILAVIPDREYAISGFVYFLCAFIVILVTIVSYASMVRQPFAMPYINDARFEDSLNIQNSGRKKMPPFFSIFKKIWLPAVSVCLVFTVTLGCFPGLLVMVKSYSLNETWRETFFTPVVCFLFFNFWDFVGRTSSFLQLPSEKRLGFLGFLVVLRLAFYPLFAFCNIQPRHHTDVIFDDDIYPMIYVTLFGFTNGYFGSLCVMYGPKLVAPELQETAGAMMSFFLVLGLAIGSLSSLAVLAFV